MTFNLLKRAVTWTKCGGIVLQYTVRVIEDRAEAVIQSVSLATLEDAASLVDQLSTRFPRGWHVEVLGGHDLMFSAVCHGRDVPSAR